MHAAVRSFEGKAQVIEWLLLRLADRLGVEPARAGEAIVPHIRFERPVPQWFTLLVILGCGGLILWLYRREGPVPLHYKFGLAALRIGLVVLVVFMLSEAVLSVERTGLPYFVVMVDDSASSRSLTSSRTPRSRPRSLN